MLASEVVPWVNAQHWEHGFCLQADGAPAHTANKTQDFCKKEFQHFWSKDMWPPSSPDMNPMDFSIQSILEAKVSNKNYPNKAALIKALMAAWDNLSPETVRATCASAPKRLEAMVGNEGGYVE